MRGAPRVATRLAALLAALLAATALFGAGLLAAACARVSTSAAAEDPPLVVVGQWVARELREPSGITFHAGRGTYFAVGDEGDLAEFTAEGRLLRVRCLRHADFEGITTHPGSGRLYVAEEGPALIHEVDPDSWRILRTFPVQRSHRGRPIIDPRRDNLEGIAFVADAAHPEGGTFWVTNQSRRLDPDAEYPSALIEVTVPLVSGRDGDRAVIRRVVFPGLADLAGVCYDARRKRLWVVSDRQDLLIACDRAGAVLGVRHLPGRDQEGVAVRGDGFRIAQDSGGVLVLRAGNGR